MRKRWMIGGVAAIGLMATALPISPAAAATPAPGFWDRGTIGSNAYSLRLSGADRYETAQAASYFQVLNQNRNSGYPFWQISNFTGGIVPVSFDVNPFAQGNPNDPANTWGLNACPGTVHIAAGDVPADALSASGVKGVTDFNPGVGVTLNVQNAVVLLTNAARGNPGTVLNPRTREALLNIAANCDNFNAVALGGTAAISPTAFAQIDAIANLTIRVDGSSLAAQIEEATGLTVPLDRYTTAAELGILLWQAQSPGGAIPVGLRNVEVYDASISGDTVSLDGAIQNTFAASVFLTEGVVGADNMSLGPVAAAYSAPVLLTRSDALPLATLAALTVMQPGSILTIGGQAAVSDDVVAAAQQAAGTTEGLRIAGATRFHTSVLVAASLAGVQSGASGTMFGFAKSTGNDFATSGAVDALPGGAILDTMIRTSATPPIRLAPPVERNGAPGFFTAPFNTSDLQSQAWFIGGTGPVQIIPMLLTTGTASGVDAAPPAIIQNYLGQLWANPSRIITGENPVLGGNEGGFAMVFGGAANISVANEQAIASLLTAGTYAANQLDSRLRTYNGATDIAPSATLNDVFYTTIDFAQFDIFGSASTDGGGMDIDQSTGGFGDPSICTYRGALSGVSNISQPNLGGWEVPSTPVDYQNKPEPPLTNNARSVWEPFQSRFMCADVSNSFLNLPAVNVQSPNDFIGPITVFTYLGGASAVFQSLSGNVTAAPAPGVVRNVQEQLGLTFNPMLPDGNANNNWCVAQVAPGSSCTASTTFSITPGVLWDGIGLDGFGPFVPLTNGAYSNNYRGVPVYSWPIGPQFEFLTPYTGRVQITQTRVGVPGSSAAQNATTIVGSINIDPLSSEIIGVPFNAPFPSTFPGGLNIRFKAETDAPIPPGPAPFDPVFDLEGVQVFSGQYTVGQDGQGAKGGIAIGIITVTLGVPGVTFPAIAGIAMTGNA